MKVVLFLGFLMVWAASALAEERKDSASETPMTFAELEKAAGGKLGVYAIDSETSATLEHRADERFPFCSTFKVIAAAAVLEKAGESGELLEKRIRYTQKDLVSYSPVTEKHLETGMTLRELAAAAIQYSDNTAGNRLIREIGGPEAVTQFARSIGNESFRLDRWETELNSAIPGDPRDTVTPASMAESLAHLMLGGRLPAAHREQLAAWLIGNTTGGKRIRAAVPASWRVGDKTGSGSYGVTNDIAILWPPNRKPIVVAIYFRQDEKDAPWKDEVVVQAMEIVLKSWGLARVEGGD